MSANNDIFMGFGPDYWFALCVYFVACLLMLYFWHSLTRFVPRPFGNMLWMMMFALLFAPILIEGAHPQLAPASVGVIFALLGKDYVRALASSLPILFMIGAGFIISYLYEQIKRLVKEKSMQTPLEPNE